MTVIEMFLRLACSLVGWMVVYAYCLWLATLRVIGCGSDGDEFWRLLLAMAPLAVVFALLTGATAKLPALHQVLRWGVVPLVLLVPLAFAAAWATFSIVNLGGQAVCAAPPAPGWQRWWAPAQFGALALICLFAIRTWRLGRSAARV